MKIECNVNVCPECSVRCGLVDNITMVMTYITTLGPPPPTPSNLFTRRTANCGRGYHYSNATATTSDPPKYIIPTCADTSRRALLVPSLFSTAIEFSLRSRACEATFLPPYIASKSWHHCLFVILTSCRQYFFLIFDEWKLKNYRYALQTTITQSRYAHLQFLRISLICVCLSEQKRNHNAHSFTSVLAWEVEEEEG